MIYPLAKLGFVHRRLWKYEATYRAAVLLGPPPLIGAVLASALWLGMQSLPSPGPAAAGKAAESPAWATVSGPRLARSNDPPEVVAPALALPGAGVPSTFVAGWLGGIQRIEIGAALDANLLPGPVAPLAFDEPAIDLKRIIAASPTTGSFAGVVRATFIVREAGTYGLTLRLLRSDAAPATCLQRLGFGKGRVVSNLQIDLIGPKTIDYEPVSFSLQPGLYPIVAAFGCWDHQQEKGTGMLTVLVHPPGAQDFRPARADEIVRPATARP